MSDVVELERLKLASKLSKKQYKVRVRECKKRLHNSYYKSNRNKFWVLDALLVLCLLFNVGALVITNMIVVKARPDSVFVESNPVQASLNGWQTSKAAVKSFFSVFVKQVLFYTILVFGYLYYRKSIIDDGSYWLVLFFMIYYIVGMGLDFFHDLGFLLGRITFGG